mgnify:CR=1 FL=1
MGFRELADLGLVRLGWRRSRPPGPRGRSHTRPSDAGRSGRSRGAGQRTWRDAAGAPARRSRRGPIGTGLGRRDPADLGAGMELQRRDLGSMEGSGRCCCLKKEKCRRGFREETRGGKQRETAGMRARRLICSVSPATAGRKEAEIKGEGATGGARTIPSREARGLRGRRRPRLEVHADDGDGAETAGSGEAARFGNDGDDGLLRLAVARRWSSCSWTTGGSGHEQGRLCLEAKRSIHRDARAAARKIRDLVGGCGWWGWIPRGRMRAVAARMGLGGWDG